MVEQEFSCWDEFIGYALGIITEAETEAGVDSGGKVSPWAEPLFRGQSDFRWGLETTLQRFVQDERRCNLYDNDMRTAGTTISTVADVKLDFDDWVSIDHSHKPIQNYNAMAWLRQNGFPSPLLDWSRSPFVASFFGYNSADSEKAEKVSIYSFIETKNGSRSGSRPSGAPVITTLGPWLSTDKKHYLQQSSYTVCRGEKDASYCYSSHEEAMKYECEDPNQMVMVKCNLPAEEKASVLRRLRKMNVTEYSLFETTESLLKTLASDLF